MKKRTVKKQQSAAKKQFNEAVRQMGGMDAILNNMAVMAAEIQKFGVDAAKVLDCAYQFEDGVNKLIPCGAQFDEIVAVHTMANMMSMDIHIKSTAVASRESSDRALLYVYLQYRTMCEQRGMLDDNGKLKE